jgi:enamine deaminase RidA (YjgF/YER057c/UK114 family)
MQIRHVNAPDAPAPSGQFTHAVEVTGASRTVYISGQVGSAMDGSIPEDATEQGRLVWKNLQAQLRAVGMSVDNIVKMVTIITSLDHLAASRVARGEALGDRKPASTLIVGGLVNPAFKIEIEVVAVA